MVQFASVFKTRLIFPRINGPNVHFFETPQLNDLNTKTIDFSILFNTVFIQVNAPLE